MFFLLSSSGPEGSICIVVWCSDYTHHSGASFSSFSFILENDSTLLDSAAEIVSFPDHVPDELEAMLEVLMDEALKTPDLCPFDLPILISIGIFNAAFPTRPLSPMDVHTQEIVVFPTPSTPVKEKPARDLRIPVGVPMCNPSFPIEDHTRDIAVTVIRTDTNDTETWILSSHATILDLRQECTRRWHIKLSLVFENLMQFDSTPLYYFCPKYVRFAPLFGVDIQHIPPKPNAFLPQPINDHLVSISVFNVNTSQRATFLIPPFATVYRLASWVAREWQHTFDLTYRNSALSHGTRIEALCNPDSPFGTPVLAFASHRLQPGDRNYFDSHAIDTRMPARHSRRLSIRKTVTKRKTFSSRAYRQRNHRDSPSPRGAKTPPAKATQPQERHVFISSSDSSPDTPAKRPALKLPIPRRTATPSVDDLSSSPPTPVVKRTIPDPPRIATVVKPKIPEPPMVKQTTKRKEAPNDPLRTVLGPNPDHVHEEFLSFLDGPKRQPAVAPNTGTPKSSSTLPPTHPGETTPPSEKNDTEDDLLRRLERVFERNNRRASSSHAPPAQHHTGGRHASPTPSERSLPPPLSKAVNRRRFNTSAPSRPRYGPESVPMAETSPRTPVMPTASLSPDPEIERIAQDIVNRRNHREIVLQEVVDLWHRLEHPRPNDSLIVESDLSEDVITMMRRGKRFAELAPRVGVNQATKRSRGFNQQRLNSFGGGAEQFANAVKDYNLQVIHLRSIRPSVDGPPRKKRRSNLP